MDTESRIINERRQKLAELRKQGINPYGYRFEKNASASEIKQVYDKLKKEEHDSMRNKVRVAGRLMNIRSMGRAEQLDGRPIPSRDSVAAILDDLFAILYPGYYGERDISAEEARHRMGARLVKVRRALAEEIARGHRHRCAGEHKVCDQCMGRGVRKSEQFLKRIPQLRRMLMCDVRAAYDGDPAATGFDEVIFSYPGLLAVTTYRVAHELSELDVPLIPRIMTEWAHSVTGIDIHPGAKIGKRFFIDHGTGVVIGETCEIGDNVKLYQGVTLGALSFPKDARGKLIRGRKRHPTIEANVTIYAGATILGGETVIGKGAVIGGNVWLTESVPPGTKVMLEPPRLRYGSKKGTKRRRK